MMEKECPICGTIFTTTNKVRKYCDNCRNHADQKWKRADVADARIKGRMCSPETVTYNCEYCGKEHTLAKSLLSKVRNSERTSWDGEVHLYCCIEHLEADKHDHTACTHCGKLLKGSEYSYSPRRSYNYCSPECESAHLYQLAAEKNWEHTCEECGERFISKKKVAYFCSQECFKSAVRKGWKSPNAANRESSKVTVTLQCFECSKTFSQTYKDAVLASLQSKLPQFCCKECSNAFWSKVREQRKAEHAEKKKVNQKCDPNMSLCAQCRTSYRDCERMQTEFRISPKGAKFNNNGIIVECPKYTGAKS